MPADRRRSDRRDAAPRRSPLPAVIGTLLVIAVLAVLGVLGVRWMRAARPATRDAVAVQTLATTTPGTAASTSAPSPTTTRSAPAKLSSASVSAVGSAPVQVQDPATDQTVPVLMYHHIMPVPSNTIAISPSTFDAQMKYLHDNGWHPVSIAELDAFVQTGKRLPSKPVLITFDDDRMNQLTYGVPILQKYGFTATFFVVKKWIVTASPSFMHESDLKQLIADKFDVESHTSNHIQIHPSVAKSTGRMETYNMMRGRYWEPTEGMRVWMDSTLGGPPVTALAYPGGRYNPDAERLMKDAGYDLAFTTDTGYVTYKGQSPYALPRWNTGARGTTLATFASVLNGAQHAARGK